MTSRFGKFAKTALPAAILAGALQAPAALAQDTIRVGITLRMVVENGLKYGQMTKDELFVTANRAKEGVVITNRSETENLVMLKHFGPGNPDSASFVR